jgi:hypothetical protein
MTNSDWTISNSGAASNTISISTGTNSTFYDFGTPIQTGGNITVTGYVWPPVQPKEERKMPEWVVEEVSDNGKKTRRRLTVNVSLDGNGAVLSEEEAKILAQSAAEKLGLKFIGKA